MSGAHRYIPCPSCGRPRRASGKASLPGSMCKFCRKQKGWHAQHRVTWNRPAPTKAQKESRYPTTSWWTEPDRAKFQANLEREKHRMQAGGSTAELV